MHADCKTNGDLSKDLRVRCTDDSLIQASYSSADGTCVKEEKVNTFTEGKCTEITVPSDMIKTDGQKYYSKLMPKKMPEPKWITDEHVKCTTEHFKDVSFEVYSDSTCKTQTEYTEKIFSWAQSTLANDTCTKNEKLNKDLRVRCTKDSVTLATYSSNSGKCWQDEKTDVFTTTGCNEITVPATM